MQTIKKALKIIAWMPPRLPSRSSNRLRKKQLAGNAEEKDGSSPLSSPPNSPAPVPSPTRTRSNSPDETGAIGTPTSEDGASIAKKTNVAKHPKTSVISPEDSDDSSSSSDYHHPLLRPKTRPTAPSAPPSLTMPSNTDAIATAIISSRVETSNPKSVPMFKAGVDDITPADINEWEYSASNYQKIRAVDPTTVIATLATGFQDPMLKNAYKNNSKAWDAMSIAEVAEEMRKEFLRDDWSDTLRTDILSCAQGADESFASWYNRLSVASLLLTATTNPITTERLLDHLRTRMLPSLQIEHNNDKNLKKEKNMKNFVAGMRDIEKKWNDEQEKVAKMVGNATKRERAGTATASLPNKRLNNGSNAPNTRTQPSHTSSQPSSNNTTVKCPPLTDAEKDYLRKNRGCMKCRRRDVAHISSDCPNGFPSGTTYKGITMSDGSTLATDAPKRPSNAAPIAAVEPVAHIRGNIPASLTAPTNASSVLGMGDGDSDDSDTDEVTNMLNRSMSAPPVSPHSTAPPVCSITSDPVPFSVPHVQWPCAIRTRTSDAPFFLNALIDSGSHIVLIREEFVQMHCLSRRKLSEPIQISTALSSAIDSPTTLTEWVKLKVSDRNDVWKSRPVRAIIAPNLCSDLILGLPFLTSNKLVFDADNVTLTDKTRDFDILRPVSKTNRPRIVNAQNERRERERTLKAENQSLPFAGSSPYETTSECLTDNEYMRLCERNPVAAVRDRIEELATMKKCEALESGTKHQYADVFQPVPHVDLMPKDTFKMSIKVKDADKKINSRSYSSPKKYRDAWQTLIDRHLEAGRIRPSQSEFASPAFLVPKADPNALPRWVNDYRQLNANTISDNYRMPRVDEILSDAGKGKWFSKMDMTDSFFQTFMDEDSVKYTAVNTPLGTFEWLVMPQGLKNSPAVHQRRVNDALRQYIGVICHVYLDDIIIWSQTLEEHVQHVRLILDALRKAKLYCNEKKSQFFRTDIDFLGHHISRRGIEADFKKAEKIINWSTPKSTTEVLSFLGLVRYLANFLPGLAEQTAILTPLTTDAARAAFPEWTLRHQNAFDAIKKIVTSRECLTVIDHDDTSGVNKIFVTCDASDLRTGAVLSYGPTWETARPVAYDSMQLKKAQLNYPVHEKELLAVIRALKRWRTDLIGNEFIVYTDHRTLENFDGQRDLSRRQARWMETMSQYDFTITYIPGIDNTVADALSRYCPPNDCEPNDLDADDDYRSACWPPRTTSAVASVLKITADKSIVDDIKEGYTKDNFCAKFASGEKLLPNVSERNGLWYIGDRLLIPRYGDIRETLFRSAHDALGHAGGDKAYAALRDAYYWPNMARDLREAYIPACMDCLRNKGTTTKPAGPLHPSPIPDSRGSSVGIDFIGPLPEDEGFNAIVTMTDRLGSDIRIIPTRNDITAEDFAVIFFNEWYCENGLPDDIFSDRDKLFVSKFWKAFTQISGIKLKMSSAFHPESDGISERSNKSVNEAIRFYVDRQQKGWVKCLPIIRFNIMNTVNASTGFSGFQLRMGRSPRTMPPIVPTVQTLSDAEKLAREVIDELNTRTAEAQDALTAAKVSQASSANKHRADDPDFNIGDRVLLSTFHRRRNYANKGPKKGEKRAAKFFPRFDGPYTILDKDTDHSTYTLDIPTSNEFPTFHVSLLRRYTPNDDGLFPSRKLAQPGPVMTEDGLEEYFIEKIVDERKRGRGRQYLVRWRGYDAGHDHWLSRTELADCEALDVWEERSTTAR